MRMRIPGLVLLVVLAALAGGCASRAATSASPGASVAGSSVAPSPTNSSGCPTELTVTATDSSKTLCVSVGGLVHVNLTAAGQKPWYPIASGSSSILAPATPDQNSAAPGVQTTTFKAIAPGTTDITSAHRACAQSPGQISCNAIVAWKVTIDVK